MAITTITNSMVSVNAIQGTLIADNAITAVHIASNAVASIQIAENNVTAREIAANTITVAQLADDCVESDKIADGVITTNHLNKAMISSQTEVAVATGDFILLGDTSDSNNLKKAPISSILAGTLTTAAQTNITSVGTLTGFTSTGIDDNADATAITIGADESVDFAKGVVVLGSGTTAGVYLNGTNSDTATHGNFVRYGTNFATQSNADNSLLITKAFNGSIFLDAFTVKSDGNVVIGDASAVTSPAFSAQQNIVKSSTYGSTGVGRNGNLYLLNTNTGGDAGFLTFGAYYNNTNNLYYQTGGIGGGKETAAGDGTWGGYLSFWTTSDGTAGAASGQFEHMRITADGNVGIGVTDPDGELHVESAGNADVYVERTSGAKIHLQAQSAFTAIGAASNHDLGLMTNASTRMRIDNTGRVGINRTPAIANSKLEVGGADNVPLINVEAIGATAGVGIGSSRMKFYYGTTEKASIDSSGNLRTARQIIQENSDGTPRFINIPYSSAGSGFTFNWDDLANHSAVGDQTSETNAFMFEVNVTSYLFRRVKALIIVDTNATNSIAVHTIHNSTLTCSASIPTGSEQITITIGGLWSNAVNYMGRITTF